MSNLTVECPTCHKPVVWQATSEFRPFCSERCRLIDLGEWASGNRTIPADADHDDATETDRNIDEH